MCAALVLNMVWSAYGSALCKDKHMEHCVIGIAMGSMVTSICMYFNLPHE